MAQPRMLEKIKLCFWQQKCWNISRAKKMGRLLLAALSVAIYSETEARGSYETFVRSVQTFPFSTQHQREVQSFQWKQENGKLLKSSCSKKERLKDPMVRTVFRCLEFLFKCLQAGFQSKFYHQTQSITRRSIFYMIAVRVFSLVA